jgi:hypothetical protein
LAKIRDSSRHRTTGTAGWFACRLDDTVDWSELTELLESAHRQIAARPTRSLPDDGP